MISLSNICTSEIEELVARLARGEGQDEFIDASVRFLGAFSPDGGADEDLIFVTGKRLSTHRVWDHIPAATLRQALQESSRKAVETFLERAPADYRDEILSVQASKKSRRDEAVKPTTRSSISGKRVYVHLKGPRSDQTDKAALAAHIQRYADSVMGKGLPQSTSAAAIDHVNRRQLPFLPGVPLKAGEGVMQSRYPKKKKRDGDETTKNKRGKPAFSPHR